MSLETQQQETPLFKELASKKQEFNPYVNNAGTVIAIAGPKFCIVAGDTRISQGFSIVSRSISKIAKLGPKTLLATSGMYADFVALGKYLKTRLQTYEFTIGRSANTQSIAALLSNTLYGKRFFPYYTFNILAGLDDNGDGICYGYDAIGSYEPKAYLCQGSAIELILPILDNQLQGYNKKHPEFPKSKEEVMELILDCFNSAAERDIYTGDGVEIVLLEENQIKSQTFKLRKD